MFNVIARSRSDDHPPARAVEVNPPRNQSGDTAPHNDAVGRHHQSFSIQPLRIAASTWRARANESSSNRLVSGVAVNPHHDRHQRRECDDFLDRRFKHGRSHVKQKNSLPRLPRATPAITRRIPYRREQILLFAQRQPAPAPRSSPSSRITSTTSSIVSRPTSLPLHRPPRRHQVIALECLRCFARFI